MKLTVRDARGQEVHTIEADDRVFGLEPHRAVVHQALLAHPLGPQADRVQAVLDDMLETNRAHLPQFWPASPSAPPPASGSWPEAREKEPSPGPSPSQEEGVER